MSATARVHGAARWLLVLASVGFFAAAAAVNSEPAPEAAKAARADEPFVIALAMQSPVSHPAPIAQRTRAVAPAASGMIASIAPELSTPPAPASAHVQARFFTINEVMAKRDTGRRDASIQIASVNPTITPASPGTDSSGSPAPAIRGKGDEPFGLFTFTAPDGQLWTKWRKVADDIRAEEPALFRCLADSTQCSQATARFAAVVTAAREQNGRARLDLVNQRVNDAIRYKSDLMQWGVADLWSPPLAANGTGSFNTGFGDCEDFAIAKYVALRAAGVPARQLRIMLVHDNIARMDHAVLAALDEGHWYILDNRWMMLVEDSEARQFLPLFALDEQGVKLLAAPYAARVEPIIEPMSEAVKGAKTDTKSGTLQKFAPGFEVADEPAPKATKALGLRPSIL